MFFTAIEDNTQPRPNNWVVYCRDGVVYAGLTQSDAASRVKHLNTRKAAEEARETAKRAAPFPAYLEKQAMRKLNDKEAERDAGMGI